MKKTVFFGLLLTSGLAFAGGPCTTVTKTETTTVTITHPDGSSTTRTDSSTTTITNCPPK